MVFKLFRRQPDAVVLFNPRNDARLLVQPEVARALEHCFHFSSLTEHLNHLFDCHATIARTTGRCPAYP
jgi:hypothetical protein